MLEDLTDKIGILSGIHYVQKSLQRNNPDMDQRILDAFADKYGFDIIIVTNCQNCEFSVDYSKTWEDQPENVCNLSMNLKMMQNQCGEPRMYLLKIVF